MDKLRFISKERSTDRRISKRPPQEQGVTVNRKNTCVCTHELTCNDRFGFLAYTSLQQELCFKTVSAASNKHVHCKTDLIQ